MTLTIGEVMAAIRDNHLSLHYAPISDEIESSGEIALGQETYQIDSLIVGRNLGWSAAAMRQGLAWETLDRVFNRSIQRGIEACMAERGYIDFHVAALVFDDNSRARKPLGPHLTVRMRVEFLKVS